MTTLIPQSSIPQASTLINDTSSATDSPKVMGTRNQAMQLAGTIIAAISVSILAFTAMSLVIGAAIGVALTRMGVSEAVIWPIIAVTGMIALFISYKLGVKVWIYETGSMSKN